MKKSGFSKQISSGAEPGWFDPDSPMRYMLDRLPQGIRIIDTQYNVCFINRSFARMSGIEAENAAGMKCWELFTSPFCHTSQCSLTRIASSCKEFQAEIERTKQDGSNIPCILSAFPVFTAENNLGGIMECFQDISDKKHTEEALRESENLCSTIFQSTGTANCIVDQGGVIAMVNNQWEKTTGYNRREVEGRMHIIDLIHPDEKTKADNLYDGCRLRTNIASSPDK